MWEMDAVTFETVPIYLAGKRVVQLNCMGFLHEDVCQTRITGQVPSEEAFIFLVLFKRLLTHSRITIDMFIKHVMNVCIYIYIYIYS
jgi:hypothetical protein